MLKKLFSLTYLLILPFSVLAGQSNQLSRQEKELGFEPLFDGKSMAQWRNYKSETIKPQWQVIDGTMVLTEKGGRDIVTKEKFSYFDLRLQWTIAEKGNSGIMFRVDEQTTKRLAWMVAPEFQLYDSYTVKGKPERAAGALYGLVEAPADITKKPGEWNRVRILLEPAGDGNAHLQCWLNDTRTIDLVIDHAPGSEWSKLIAKRNEEKKGTKFELPDEFFKTASGPILLQDHGARVAFRNIRIRRLNSTAVQSNPGSQKNRHVFSVKGKKVCLNGNEFKVIGLRCSNALVSDGDVAELIDNLDVFKSYGVNTVSVFFMGSRFGDVKGYRPDASIDPVYAARMARIIEQADRRGMVVLVGCLYWSNSRAKEDLGYWKQVHANEAVANTVRWLKEHNFRNVFVDPDNEGMASRATGWSIKKMIDAAHKVDPSCVIGYNNKAAAPDNADILLHHSPKDGLRAYIESEGSPGNTPGGYWDNFSKSDGYYNYIRIGRYTGQMKDSQIDAARDNIANHAGYMLASTWIQCAPHEGIGGPFMTPGRRAESLDINDDIKELQSDAGILWWLQWIKSTYGPWNPPATTKSP